MITKFQTMSASQMYQRMVASMGMMKDSMELEGGEEERMMGMKVTGLASFLKEIASEVSRFNVHV